MRSNPAPLRADHWLAGALSLLLTLASLPALAVKLGDEPLAARNPVPPNVLLTIDNSGAMQRDFLPDDVHRENSHCRSRTGSGGACAEPSTRPPDPTSLGIYGVGTSIDTFDVGQPPFRSSAFNGMYYDPLVTYDPPYHPDDASGAPRYRSQNRANTADWTSVLHAPYASTSTVDMTRRIPVPIWCATNSPTAADLADPAVCRTNGANPAYATSPGDGGDYLYPNATFYNNQDSLGSSRFAARVPHHYWKASVEWCRSTDTTTRWLGFGLKGTCQAARDPAAGYTHPRFYRFGTAAATGNTASDPSAFQRVDLDPASPAFGSVSHTYIDALGETRTIARTFDEEMTNYANWFAYYRTRIDAAKTTTSLAFARRGADYRVGLHALNQEGGAYPFVDVGSFDSAKRKAWYDRLFALRAGGGTPILDAIARIGKYYQNGTAGLGGTTDPITLSCQKNWHVLLAGSVTEQDNPTSTVANVDSTVPTLPLVVSGLTPGAPWPPLYRENPSGIGNAISDYATQYWSADLRPAAPDDVAASERDPAGWQHLNFAAVALGGAGKLPAGEIPSIVENRIAAGVLTWPPLTLSPVSACRTTSSANACPDASGYDDLWHAAVNGRGRYVAARSASRVRGGMEHVLQDIANQAASSVGVAFANANLSTTNNFVYRARLEPGWAGSLAKVEIDPQTGAEIKTSTGTWRAAERLNTMLAPTGAVPKPWTTVRKVVTINDATNAPVPFQLANLSSTQQASLGSSTLRQQAIVDFLRGDRSNEGFGEGQFRIRGSPLGDIADSLPVYVGPPKQPYLDVNDKGYSAFKASFATRPARVYVGANDGMLHVFDDGSGEETWAFIPKAMFVTDTSADRCGLAGLAYPDTGASPGTNCSSEKVFRHRYYVNATPRVADIDLKNDGTGWRTIVVGGLGKGGRSYFALDATDPASITGEAAAAAKVMWEYTNPELGYTYGKALVAKVRAALGSPGSPQTWVVIVPSGYDSTSAAGKLYFLDPATGARLVELQTPGPSDGLAHVAGYTRDPRNQFVEQIYGGDLAGNLWRFDVADADPAKWSVTRLARLTDAGGTAQPVTTPPRIEVDVGNGIDRWVLVGTGRLLHEDDLADTQRQTMYAIRDGTASAPATITTPIGRGDLVEVSSAGGLVRPPDKGWYDDLDAGERIVTALPAGASLVAYAATLPAAADKCAPGQLAKTFVRELGRGRSQLRPIAGSGYVESVTVDQGVAGLDLIALERVGSLPGAYFGDARIAVTTRKDGEMQTLRVDLPTVAARHRMSWRVIPSD